MALAEDIYSTLSGDAAVSALVSTRIYPLKMPQNPVMPAITYRRVSGARISSIDGITQTDNPRYQVDVWGSSYDSVRSVVEPVIQAMDGSATFKAVMITDLDFYEDDTTLYRAAVDFSIWSQL